MDLPRTYPAAHAGNFLGLAFVSH